MESGVGRSEARPISLMGFRTEGCTPDPAPHSLPEGSLNKETGSSSQGPETPTFPSLLPHTPLSTLNPQLLVHSAEMSAQLRLPTSIPLLTNYLCRPRSD